MARLTLRLTIFRTIMLMRFSGSARITIVIRDLMYLSLLIHPLKQVDQGVNGFARWKESL